MKLATTLTFAAVICAAPMARVLIAAYYFLAR